ncbi:MAG: hypothetical protein V1918_05160 [Planctomycetota bacterium]
MRVATFVLFVVLLSMIAFLAAHEEITRFHAGYRIGDLVARRARLREEANTLKAELATLTAPEHLKALNRELSLGLTALQPQPFDRPGNTFAHVPTAQE